MQCRILIKLYSAQNMIVCQVKDRVPRFVFSVPKSTDQLSGILSILVQIAVIYMAPGASIVKCALLLFVGLV